MINTVRFKCRSLVNFVVMSELVSIVIPDQSQQNISQILENRNFDEFYCFCERSYPHEKRWREHFIGVHGVLAKLFMTLKFTPKSLE